MNTLSTSSPGAAAVNFIEERSEAFVDDIMEGIVDPNMDSLLRLSG